MSSIRFESYPISGAEVELDGEYVGTTPFDKPFFEVGNIDMVVFVSPQYKNDVEILSAIQTYADAVKMDIGWRVVAVAIDESWNEYELIKNKIQELSASNLLKTCMMIGDDMGQAWTQPRAFDYRYPYCYSPSLPVSFLIPFSDDGYATKKSQIINALRKFSINRNANYGNDIICFVDASDDYMGISKVEVIEGELPKIGNLKQFQNAEQQVLNDELKKDCKMFVAAGHAYPYAVWVDPSKARFYATDVMNLRTNLVAVDGCWANGWRIPSEIDKDTPYPPTIKFGHWFGHKIFESVNVRAIVSGFPVGAYKETSHNPYDEGFICTGMDDMASGKTLAEAIGGKNIECTRNLIYGDPTFHFSR